MPRRVPFPELPIRRHRRVHWGIVWAIGAVVMAGLSVLQMIQQQDEKADIMMNALLTGQPAVPMKTEPTSFAENAVVLSPTELDPKAEFEKASRVLEQFLHSPAGSPVAAMLRDSAEVIAQHQIWQSRFPIDLAQPLQVGPKFAMMDDLLVTSLMLQDGSRRFIAFERNQDRYRLDWSSMTGWGECALAELATLPTEKPIKIRVDLGPAKLPDHYELSHPDQPDSVIAYGEPSLLRQGAAGRKLTESGRGFFIVEVAQVDSFDHGRRLEIRDVIQTGWIEGLQSKPAL